MERIPIGYQISKGASPVDIARKYLWIERYQDNDGPHIRFYKNEFFVYDGTHYQIVYRESLLVKILAFLQDQKALNNKATMPFARNVLMNIAAQGQVPDDVIAPCFLKTQAQTRARLISLKNGIFDLDLYMQGKKPLLPHSSDFFSFSSLPFAYDSKANCPTWKKFLNEVLPDRDLQRLLQEWFGYNLTYDTSHQRFVLMVGQGGDGKSVIATVLIQLLGKENVSAVSLEQFCGSRTFPLHEMVGKLANVVGEIGDIKKVAEGILKNISGGGFMTVERKGKDPTNVKFTAKLTFLTNDVPRFRDRTDGLWRRIIFVPFNVQTLDPTKQNRSFTDDNWWLQSGEIQGIFNWALEGLVRLTKRGRFVEPQASLDMKAEYKEEANVGAGFLLENYEVKAGSTLCSNHLYTKYARALRAQGATPLGKPLFTREVKKTFPLAKLSANARVTSKHQRLASGLRRARVWENLREKP